MAFTSPSDFDVNDVIVHVRSIGTTPVRIDAGADDPFAPGVHALAQASPRGAEVNIRTGCHDDRFMISAQPAAFTFLASHLAA